MKVWPLREKPTPMGFSLVSFTTEHWSEAQGDIVATIHITSPELALQLVEKAVREGAVGEGEEPQYDLHIEFNDDGGVRWMGDNRASMEAEF